MINLPRGQPYKQPSRYNNKFSGWKFYGLNRSSHSHLLEYFKTRKTTSKLTQSDSNDVFLKYQLYFLNTFPSPSETLRSKIRISVFVKPLIGKIKSCQNAKWDE